MNPLEQLNQEIKTRLPATTASLDRPKNPGASWWMDLSHRGNFVTVEWRPEIGFGVNAGAPEYGEKPDEFYSQPDEARRRILELLLSGSDTVPSKKVLMKRIRELGGLTQVDLAKKLKIKQSTVSKIESNQDICLSTLLRYVTTLGGELTIHVQIADRLLTLEGSALEEAISET